VVLDFKRQKVSVLTDLQNRDDWIRDDCFLTEHHAMKAYGGVEV
jgi:hypothetical protein